MNVFSKFCLLISVCFMIFLCSGCFTQNPNILDRMMDSAHNHYFKNKIEPGSELIKTRVHYSLERTTDGRYVYKQYYPERHVKTLECTYHDAAMTVKHGKYQTWNDHGAKRSEGNYVNGKREGKWTNYHPDGGFAKGKYQNNTRHGEWTNYDSLGVKEKTTPYEFSKINGTIKTFKNGELVKKDFFKDNNYISSEYLTADSTQQEIYKLVEQMPLWIDAECNKISSMDERKNCGQKKMLEFIYKSIRYPGYAREEDIEGTAIIRFVVEKDGTINEIETVRGICEDIEKECLRVIRSMPKWIPGEQDGKPVKVYFNMPIKFSLQ